MLTPRRRTLHLIDIENLAGSARPSARVVRDLRNDYGARVQPGDLVIVAANHGAAPVVWWEWPGARHLPRSGPNGADEALLEVIRTEHAEQRFDRVVIASGDAIFAMPAAELARRGVSVAVVARRGSLARRLQLAAGTFELIEASTIEMGKLA